MQQHVVSGASASSVSTRSIQVEHPPFDLGCVHLQPAFQGEDNIFPFGPGRHLSDGGTNGALAELIAAPSATEAISGELPLSEVPRGKFTQLPYSQSARPRQPVRDGQ